VAEIVPAVTAIPAAAIVVARFEQQPPASE
jgi:hypothetical protein